MINVRSAFFLPSHFLTILPSHLLRTARNKAPTVFSDVRKPVKPANSTSIKPAVSINLV
jgi:hypothetical protein